MLDISILNKQEKMKSSKLSFVKARLHSEFQCAVAVVTGKIANAKRNMEDIRRISTSVAADLEQLDVSVRSAEQDASQLSARAQNTGDDDCDVDAYLKNVLKELIDLDRKIIIQFNKLASSIEVVCGVPEGNNPDSE